jgi:hypothetical protein
MVNNTYSNVGAEIFIVKKCKCRSFKQNDLNEQFCTFKFDTKVFHFIFLGFSSLCVMYDFGFQGLAMDRTHIPTHSPCKWRLQCNPKCWNKGYVESPKAEITFFKF